MASSPLTILPRPYSEKLNPAIIMGIRRRLTPTSEPKSLTQSSASETSLSSNAFDAFSLSRDVVRQALLDHV